jgi:hypothetical protein
MEGSKYGRLYYAYSKVLLEGYYCVIFVVVAVCMLVSRYSPLNAPRWQLVHEIRIPSVNFYIAESRYIRSKQFHIFLP